MLQTLKKIRHSLIVSFLLAQAGWFACVLGASYGYEFYGIAGAMLITAWHVFLSYHPLPELKLVFWTGMIGVVCETILAHTGLVLYEGTQIYSGGTTWWLLAMWVLFGCFINTLMRFLKGHYVYAALLGAIGGPMAYIPGSNFGALSFTNTLYAGGMIGVLWFVALPLMIKLSNQYDGNKSS